MNTNNHSSQNQNSSRQGTDTKRGAWLKRLFFFSACAVYFELLLHIFLFQSIDSHIVYPILFGILIGTASALVTGLLPRILRRILSFVILFGLWLMAEIQLIYHAVFGNLMPITQLQMGGGVLSEFMDQTIYAIRQNIFAVLALTLPLFVWILILILRKAPRERDGWRKSCVLLAILICLSGLTVGMMHLACRHPNPVWRIFHSTDTSTDQSYRNIGMTATTVQELRYLLFPPEKEGGLLPNVEDRTSQTEYDPELWNVLPELDFEALAASTENETLQNLDRWFAGEEPTAKNDYTGLLKGYNIIELCAESYSPWFVSEELTPTLYRMSHSGLVFDNYYGTFNSMTTNGEYGLCLGLLPDMTRIKSQSSFDESVGHYLPFCLGTILKDYGYSTLAYHNNNGEFYNRARTHPNMGYQFRSQGNGLNVTPQRPASDLEMIEQSVEEYIHSDQPFHAYYMTYSGHYHYTWGNAMSAKHRAEVEDLPYSDTVKAYIACNLDLELAMRCLEEKLEEAGKLNNTIIVLTNDHYPYGLKPDEYNELAGQKIDTDFEKYHNSLICYVPGLGRTVHVSEYCSTIDVLPTLLNLLGVSYDSRLLPGTDIFAPGRHAAILQDGRFVTDGFRYAESSGELIYDGEQPSQETVEEYRRWVTECFEVSREILYSDYYAHVFPGDHDVVEGESLPFDDVTRVRVQANVLFIYRKGLVDLYSERYFGMDEPATVGDWVTAVYRYLGKPAFTEDALPENYPSEDPEAQAAFLASPQHDAVCWAFEQGIMKAEDRTVDYSVPMDNAAMCLMLYRTTAMLGTVSSEISPDAEDLLPENAAWITGEERQAVAWALEHKMIAGSRGEEDRLFENSPDIFVNRYRLVLFLLIHFYPEIPR